MTDTLYLCLSILTMALVTYLIRALPLTVFHKKIQNRWVRSFLYYVPYACLSAMTFPAIFYATQSLWSAAAGVAARIADRANRPAENGATPRAGAVLRPDVNKLTRAQREQIARRVAHGETIRF